MISRIITVLKGASATAIYGKRGGTGVILITTKSGKNNQKLRVDYSGSFEGSTVNRVQHMQNYLWTRVVWPLGFQ